MKRAALLIALFLWISPEAHSDTSPFETGNRAYVEERFPEAVAEYEALVREGVREANVFYNLGNAYYRVEQPGRAVLNYHRALALEPAHAEARANLRHVASETRAAMELTDGATRHLLRVPDAGLTWMAATFFWITVAAGLSALLGPRPWRRHLAGWGIAAGIAFLITGAATLARPDLSAVGIVVSAEAKAYYAPTRAGSIVAGLPPGTSVTLLDSGNDWTYAQLRDGQRGWIQADALEELVP